MQSLLRRWRRRNGAVNADGIFYDVSEFVAAPSRTGIQRVVYEVLNNWTFHPPLRPAFISKETGNAVLLPDSFLPLMRGFFSGGGPSEVSTAKEIAACARVHARPLRAEEVAQFSGFVNLEAFSELARIEFYRRLMTSSTDRMHWLIHDLLVWLRPEFFPPGASAQLDPYLALASGIPHLHFTSAATNREFCARFPGGDRGTYRVSALGADGLGTAAPAFSPSKRRFVCIGTVEPRKNHRIVLDAFERLWARGADIELTFIGRLGWTLGEPGWKPSEIGDELLALSARNPRFQWNRGLDDGELRNVIKSSRATIYASEVEGFGLPPLESLSLGVPVIASARLPSLEIIGSRGQIRLAEISVATVAEAVAEMMDDRIAAAKCREIPDLNLPTWKALAESLHRAMTAP
jgi:glycosyltransferase involved in cell wall biosynthesis